MNVADQFEITHATNIDLESVRDFQEDNGTEFLWPRTKSEFEQFIDQRELFIVKNHAGAIVGMSYLRVESEEWEFGGVLTAPEIRKRGLARLLGIAAISQMYLIDKPAKLIAHVHVKNMAPRNLLTKHLGFRKKGPPVKLADHEAPPSMARNADGEVEGDVFEFEKRTLLKFADTLESFDGTSNVNATATAVSINLPVMELAKQEGLDKLRALVH